LKTFSLFPTTATADDFDSESSSFEEAAALTNSQTPDLDALVDGETSIEEDGFDLLSVEPDALYLEEDLLGDEVSSQEWNLEAEEEATPEAQATMFEWDAVEAPQSAADSKTSNFEGADALTNPSTSDLDALLGDETLEDTDALDLTSSAFDDLNLEEDLFGDAVSSQEWNLEAEEEATPETQAAMFEWDAVEAPPSSADSRTSNFEGADALTNPSTSDLDALLGDETLEDTDALDLTSSAFDDLNLEEDLFGDAVSSQEWNLEAEEEATPEAQATMFEWDAVEAPPSSADSRTSNFEGADALTNPSTSDLDALLGDETLEDTDALDLTSSAFDDLNLEEDLFGDAVSSQEWNLEAEEEATPEAQATMFEWDAVEAPQSTADSRTSNFEGADALTNPSTSDLDALLGDETLEDTDALDLTSSAFDDLNLQEDLFGDAVSSQEWNLEAEEEATPEAQAAMFEWDAAESPQAAEEANTVEGIENLEDLFGAEADEFTDDQDWDEVLNAAQGSDTPSVATEALSEEWGFETEEDALGLDWEEASSLEESHRLSAEELEVASLQASVAEPLSATQGSASEWEGLDDLLGEEIEGTTQIDDFSFLTSQEAEQALSVESDDSNEFDDLEAMLAGETTIGNSELDEFDDLEAMLAQEAVPAASSESADIDMFGDLELLLGEQSLTAADQSTAPVNSVALNAGATEDDFGDLEKLLEQADKTMGGPPTVTADQRNARSIIRPRTNKVFEQMMRVPIKHLDSLSNLVGELVVNRNTLEQDQERLRQFLDNLSHQVLALSDVGARMQDLYERTLLESSLLASRQSYRSSFNSDRSYSNNSSSELEFDPLEMDRFTGFHLLSQEMIELIVRVRESASDIEFLVDETDQVARMLRQVTTQLQEGLTRSRMVPFAQNADRLLRAVHEISRKLGKEAQLHVDGRETLIDKMILEHLYDPMTHLVNNALTHGIEMPEVRRAAGKPIAGQITLRAFLQGNQTVISISDDGAGINPEKIRSKVIEKRLITPAEAKTLSRLDLYDFLFHPGFTTKDKADDFSGRGVGMDVVRTSLSEIRGTIHIDSTIGKGTTFTIRLPLTLSICKALCCLSERARIAFPMDGVEDMLDLSPDRIQTNSEGQTCIQWRDTLLPFQSLSELLKYNRQVSRGSVYGGKREDNLISIVVLRSAGNFIAIQVDQVLGEQEIVIKQLEGPAPKPVGIAGATVLGDGRIMPIADVLELIDLAMGRIRKDGGVTIWSRENPQDPESQEIPEAKSEPMVLIVDDSITVRELLSMTFNKAGYRVEQARDGQEAWDKLRSGLPCDIVFCDIEMPRMDGLELLSRLQKEENLRKLPIAMLTSRGADRHRQMASQLGASGYFTKPYLEEVLLDAAQRMIKGEVLFTSTNV
jgi:chemosensory pili system protein ChpA (sensor histidine kinase/response regulator)